MKRTLQVLAATLLALPLPAIAFEARTTASATDAAPDVAIVPRGHWAYMALERLAQAGVVGSFPTTLPGYTRHEFALATALAMSAAPNAKLEAEKTHLRTEEDALALPNRAILRDVVTRAEVNDLLTALRREFADEMAQQGVRVESSHITEFRIRASAPASPLKATVLEGRAHLLDLQARLRPLLVGKWQNATIEVSSDTLTAQFRTAVFAVHARGKNGEFETAWTPERGPQHDGFLLRVTLRDARPGEVLPRPYETREPYWTTWRDEFRLSTEAINSAEWAGAPKRPAEEHPDVPRGAWVYAALQPFVDAGLLPRPQDANRAMTRIEFAVAVTRLIEGKPPAELSKPQAEALAKAENISALADLRREFADEMPRLGISEPMRTRHTKSIRPEAVQVQLLFGPDTDAAMIEALKRAVKEWELGETRQFPAQQEPLENRVTAPNRVKSWGAKKSKARTGNASTPRASTCPCHGAGKYLRAASCRTLAKNVRHFVAKASCNRWRGARDVFKGIAPRKAQLMTARVCAVLLPLLA